MLMLHQHTQKKDCNFDCENIKAQWNVFLLVVAGEFTSIQMLHAVGLRGRVMLVTEFLSLDGQSLDDFH